MPWREMGAGSYPASRIASRLILTNADPYSKLRANEDPSGETPNPQVTSQKILPRKRFDSVGHLSAYWWNLLCAFLLLHEENYRLTTE